MQERVRQKTETATDKQVYLRGDGAVQLQELMKVIDSLKDAGVVNVGIVAKAPGESDVDVERRPARSVGEPAGLPADGRRLAARARGAGRAPLCSDAGPLARAADAGAEDRS